MYANHIIEGYEAVTTASVSDAVDAIAGRRGYMDYNIKPRINEKKLIGPAVTIQEGPTDEALPPELALDAIDESPAGSVIVIAIDGVANVAVWGGMMTAGAAVNGLAGAILDGGLRDVAEIRRDYDFPVFSRSVSPASTVGRYKTVAADVPVVCGGVTVHPGDLIVADPEGVVVVPREHAEAVLEMAAEIEAREAEQARYIREVKSVREGMAKFDRI